MELGSQRNKFLGYMKRTNAEKKVGEPISKESYVFLGAYAISGSMIIFDERIGGSTSEVESILGFGHQSMVEDRPSWSKTSNGRYVN